MNSNIYADKNDVYQVSNITQYSLIDTGMVNSSAWILFIQLDTSDWIYIIHFCRKQCVRLQYQPLNILSYQVIIFPPISGMFSAPYSSRQTAGIIPQ